MEFEMIDHRSKGPDEPIHDVVSARLAAAVKEIFDLEVGDVTVEVPPRTELGDLAFPVAFDLVKRLKAAGGQKLAPRDVASRLAQRLTGLAGVSRVEVAGAGYINVYLDRCDYILGVAGTPAPPVAALGGKIIVEHTSVNPNKAAHIGHLRNSVLGDTIVRMFRARGETVETQNYVDNTGVQVADVIVGFKYLEGKSLDDVKSIDGKLDYYCWHLYARVGGFYAEDKSRLALRAEVLHEIESGEGETHRMADYISTRILDRHLDTMFRLGITYDALPRESDVLHMKLWERAFELLKERGAVHFETDGRLSGCWVMRSSESENDGEAVESEHEADKVIVRSDGTVTYTGKDIGLHLWKLGHLGLNFYYKPFRTYPDGHVVWITTSRKDENDPTHPHFGDAAAYFNVIDIGQSYLQHYVKLGVMAVDHDERVRRSAHLAYEKVVLSPAAAEQLGQTLSEEDLRRGGVTMSGRKGLGVKADDLIDQLESNALAEVKSRHPLLSEEDQRDTAHKIAVGALRYFLLKYTRTSTIAFDFKEALAFDGETGPYIQYSVVRANSIFRKALEAGIVRSEADLGNAPAGRLGELLAGADGDELWSLLYLAGRFQDVLRGAVAALEPAIIAKWAFQLAQRFNLFYHSHHILSEKDEVRRELLFTITSVVRRQLVAALGVLGIEAPERM